MLILFWGLPRWHKNYSQYFTCSIINLLRGTIWSKIGGNVVIDVDIFSKRCKKLKIQYYKNADETKGSSRRKRKRYIERRSNKLIFLTFVLDS